MIFAIVLRNSYNENISYQKITYNNFKAFLEPCEEQGELLRNQRHLSPPKAARYQARIYLADPLVFACRVFAVLL